MFIWDHALGDTISTPHGCSRVAEHPGVAKLSAAKLSAVIAVTTMASDNGDEFDSFCSFWWDEGERRTFGVVVLVKCSSSEQWHDLERN